MTTEDTFKALDKLEGDIYDLIKTIEDFTLPTEDEKYEKLLEDIIDELWSMKNDVQDAVNGY